MTIKTVISFTSKELETLVNTLQILANACDNDTMPGKCARTIDNAFEALSDLICLDPEGERLYHNEGW